MTAAFPDPAGRTLFLDPARTEGLGISGGHISCTSGYLPAVSYCMLSGEGVSGIFGMPKQSWDAARCVLGTSSPGQKIRSSQSILAGG